MFFRDASEAFGEEKHRKKERKRKILQNRSQHELSMVLKLYQLFAGYTCMPKFA